MTPSSVILPLAAVCLVLSAVAAGLDLHEVETHTLVVYTTPAAKDVLEKSVIPTFTRETGIRVVPVYLTAAEEYYRVRLSRDSPEADLFVHASPLYLEKGYMEGVIEPYKAHVDVGAGEQSRAVPGGRIWQSFGWSPLVEVFRPGDGPVDLATDTGKVGFAHPLLSNNGIYNVLLFEAIDPAAGQRALDRTVVQPVNAAATIGGVADGSYDVTLGYEAVANLYKAKGAKIEAGIPIIGGHNVSTPVLFSVGLVRNHPHPAATTFIDVLFGHDVQAGLGKYGLRPTVPGVNATTGRSLEGVRMLDYDWASWRTLEAALPRYEVKS